MKVNLKNTIKSFSNDLQKAAQVVVFVLCTVFLMELTVSPELREEEEPSGFLRLS